MKFPQIEKAILEEASKGARYETDMLRGAELALSALGEEPPTLTDEQVSDLVKLVIGYLPEPRAIAQARRIISEAFRLLFRSEPEIPPEVKAVIAEHGYSVDPNICAMSMNLYALGKNAGVELGKRGGK